jgi:hypothetical protein
MSGESVGNPTLVFPFNPERAEVAWRPNGLKFRSPWSLHEQRFRRGGQWYFRYEWALLTRRQYGQLMALFNRNADDTFTTYDIARPTPTLVQEGIRNATDYDGLQVNNAAFPSGQTGRTLVLKGAPSSVPMFVAGDLFSVGTTGEVYEVAADVSSIGTALTVTFNQYIRTPPGADAQILATYCPIRVWMAAPVAAEVTDGPPMWGVIAEMYEAI